MSIFSQRTNILTCRNTPSRHLIIDRSCFYYNFTSSRTFKISEYMLRVSPSLATSRPPRNRGGGSRMRMQIVLDPRLQPRLLAEVRAQDWTKSHTVCDDLRASGFLKLPSGRTFSDYKNFCSSKYSDGCYMRESYLKKSYINKVFQKVESLVGSFLMKSK